MAPILLGDTATFSVEVRDLTTGNLVDPDGNALTFAVYDPNRTRITSVAAVRDSVGKYHYDYTIPDNGKEGLWTAEFTGKISNVPFIYRQEFGVLFRP